MIQPVSVAGSQSDFYILFGQGTHSLQVIADFDCDVLLIGGGGGGGHNGGGGGGAGGLVLQRGVRLLRSTYAITVGAGGVSSPHSYARGSNGGNSVFNGWTASGGGGGASRDGGEAGSAGGSGGGGAGAISATQSTAGAGTLNQGFGGGAGTSPDLFQNSAGGGGGGAGTAGTQGSIQRGGNGGQGRMINIRGFDEWFAGGGFGGVAIRGNVGKHGLGQSNFGGGAGGDSGRLGKVAVEAVAKSGVLIIRYKVCSFGVPQGSAGGCEQCAAMPVDLPYSQIQMSSIWGSTALQLSDHNRAKLDSETCWAPVWNWNYSNVTFDLGQPAVVAGAATQARKTFPDQYVTRYRVLRSLPDGSYKGQEEYYSGNSVGMSDILATSSLPSLDVANRFVAINPTEWVDWPSMRASPRLCLSPMATAAAYAVSIEYQYMRFSSTFNSNAPGVGYGRGKLDSTHAWCASVNSAGQWLHMDLLHTSLVGGVVTQGRGPENPASQWVTQFTVQVSPDCSSTYVSVMNSAGQESFAGNTDKNSRVVNWFQTPVFARCVRITPTAWNNAICMRAAALSYMQQSLPVYPAKNQILVYPPGPAGAVGIFDFAKERTISTFPYANGIYSLDWSSVYLPPTNFYSPSMIFNKNFNDNGAHWLSGTYSSATGAYAGTAFVVSGYTGEWIKLNMPVKIHLFSIRIYARSNFLTRAPSSYVFYGSHDGNTWTPLVIETNAPYINNVHTSTPVNSSLVNTAYAWYALVVNMMHPSNNGGVLNFEELELYGSEELNCTKGSFYNTTLRSCELCPTGKYSMLDAMYECTSCPAGTSLPYVGASSASECKPCPAGSYSTSAKLQDGSLAAAVILKYAFDSAGAGLQEEYWNRSMFRLVSSNAAFDSTNVAMGQGSVSFNGVSFLSIPFSFNIYPIASSTGITVSLWFRMSASSTEWAPILQINGRDGHAKNNAKLWLIQRRSNTNNIQLFCNGQSYDMSYTAVDNRFHHLVWSVSASGTWRAHIDNQLLCNDCVTNRPVPFSQWFIQRIGGFIGNVDDLIFFEGVVNATQVSQLYYSSPRVLEIVAWYPFEGEKEAIYKDALNSSRDLLRWQENIVYYDAANYRRGTGSVFSTGNVMSLPNTIDVHRIATSTGITVSFWARVLTGTVPTANIFHFAAQSSNFLNYFGAYLIESRGHPTFWCKGGNFVPAVVMTDNAFHHVSWSISSAGVWTIYIDNVLIVGPTLAVGSQRTFQVPNVQNWETRLLGGFRGNLDDFYIFSKVLSATEVSMFFNAPVSGIQGPFDILEQQIRDAYACTKCSPVTYAQTQGSSACIACEYGQGSFEFGSSDAESCKNWREIPVKSMSAWMNFACAIQETDKVKCWGENTFGQLGQGDPMDRGLGGSLQMGSFLLPVQLSNIEHRGATYVSAGASHACAILSRSSEPDCFMGAGMLEYPPASLGNAAPSAAPYTVGSATLTSVDYGSGSYVLKTSSAWFSGKDIRSASRAFNKAISANDGWQTAASVYNTASGAYVGSSFTNYMKNNITVSCMGEWIQMSSPSQIILKVINITTSSGASILRSSPYSWDILASNDETIWTLLGSVNAGWTIATGGETITTTMHRNNRPFSHYRVCLKTGKSTDGMGLILIGELRFYGSPCSQLNAHDLKCWGWNENGQLGLGDTANRGDNSLEMGPMLMPVSLGLGRHAVQVSAGNAHTCVVLDNAMVKCWGSNARGQLGLGDTAARGDGSNEMGDSLPLVNLGTGVETILVDTGGSHTCALLHTSSMIKCWGSNQNGQLGIGDAADRGTAVAHMGNSLPQVNLGTQRTARDVGLGALFTCALLDSWQVKCWGSNSGGQLGINTRGATGLNVGDAASEMGDALPTVNLGADRTVKHLSVGHSHACVILDNDQVKCWGDNTFQQLGYGDTLVRGNNTDSMGDNLPYVILGPPERRAKSIAAGYKSTCVILDDNVAKCWGDADSPMTATDSSVHALSSLDKDSHEETVNLGHYFCKMCEPGMFMAVPCSAFSAQDSVCQTCGMGTYSTGEYATSCTQCRAGTYSNAVGAYASDICIPCTPGNVSVSPGSSQCSACQAGTYSNPAGTACMQCPSGTFSSTIAATNISACMQCPPGSYAARGSSSCTSCPAGTYSISAGESCIRCPSSTYSSVVGASSQSSCLPCPAGTASYETGATNSSSCKVWKELQITNISHGSGSSSHTCAILEAGDLKCWGLNRNKQLGESGTLEQPFNNASIQPVAVNFTGDYYVLFEAGRHSITFNRSIICDVLLVGGGGGGGQNGGGGGGAGGVIYLQKIQLFGTYNFEVGAGGAQRVSGGNTIFHNWTAIGGGRGATRDGGGAGDSGGSGGGGAGASSSPRHVAGSGTQDQGNQGGSGTAPDATYNAAGGGGGGAGSHGTAATTARGGNGGDGRLINIRGSSEYFAGGGRGGKTYNGVPGTHGLGRSNYGGGGGGGSGNSNADAPWVDVPGNSGVVIIRYHAFVARTASTPNMGDNADEMGNFLPKVILGVGRRAVQVATGGSHTCALMENAGVKCWGSNSTGQLASGGMVQTYEGPDGAVPQVVFPTHSSTARFVTAGENHTCAVLNHSQVQCWGSNSHGQLGLGDTIDRATLTTYSSISLGTSTTVLQVSSGALHNCALVATGSNNTVKCWGSNAHGQLGLGDTANRGDNPNEMGESLPSLTFGTFPATQVAAGSNHTCALLTNSQVKCWGFNAHGQLGLGHTNSMGDAAGEMGDSLPLVSLGTNRSAMAIFAGQSHTCAILDNEQVKCWGNNANGQLGLGDTSHRGDHADEMGNLLPSLDLGHQRRAKQLVLGAAHTCALLDSNEVKCWGQGRFGQLGSSSTTDIRRPPTSSATVKLGNYLCSRCMPGQFVSLACSNILGDTQCRPCAGGSYSVTGAESVCMICSAGTYSSLPSSSTGCISCPRGRYSAASNASSNATCISCPTNTYSEVLGANTSTACIACPVGKSSPATGATSLSACQSWRQITIGGVTTSYVCNSCPPGQFLLQPCNVTHDTRCGTCSPGTYSVQTNASGCTSCSLGNYARAGSSVCSVCWAGTYADPSTFPSECSDCEPGKYMPNRAATGCLSCDQGKFSQLGATVCTSCPAGTFANATGQPLCHTCPRGTFTLWTGALQCEGCPLGTYDDNDEGTRCTPCPRGQFSNTTGATSCQGCPAGTQWTVELGSRSASECAPCEPGSYLPGQQAAQGFSCYQCPAGSYSEASGASSDQTCQSCPMGKYSDLLGLGSALLCQSCPAGTYSGDSMATSDAVCNECPAGTYSDLLGASNVGMCKNCPAGTFSGTEGAESIQRCIHCPAGTYSEYEGVVQESECFSCPAGKFSSITGLNSSLLCINCPAGTFSLMEGMNSSFACLKCPVGKFSSAEGAVSEVFCMDCLPGSYADEEGQSLCNLCPEGKYSAAASGTSIASCLSCPQGMYSYEGSSDCLCKKGTYSFRALVSSVSTCLPCPVGQFSSEDASLECQQCPAGTYSSVNGSAQCTHCPNGTFSPVVGANRSSVCNPCPAGTSYSGSQGASSQDQCSVCPAGKHAAMQGSPVCTDCPIGSFSESNGATGCSNCSAGFSTTHSGASACSLCQAGSYWRANTTQLLPACEACPAGTYSAVNGSLTCLPCLSGTFSSQPGATVCDQCGAGYESRSRRRL